MLTDDNTPDYSQSEYNSNGEWIQDIEGFIIRRVYHKDFFNRVLENCTINVS